MGQFFFKRSASLKKNSVKHALKKIFKSKFSKTNNLEEFTKAPTEIIIENYFKTAHLKNALLSYIIYPFTGEVMTDHSNHRECFIMAEILNSLGYNVDVINWNNTTFLPSKRYDVVIDNHNNLERLSSYLDVDTKKIFHATNAHWLFQNKVEYVRYHEFYLKTGKAILPPRLITPGNSAAYCDIISMFGNKFTQDTYGALGKKIYHLPMSVTGKIQVPERNYTDAKTKFIWLNSGGALLKGLDVAIDAFTMSPDCELYIFGNPEKDKDFFEAIKNKTKAAKNIFFKGWTDIESENFYAIAEQCAWVIGTSFSEGGGGSILNCMAKGLVPVISISSSIDLPDNTGFYLENNDAETLRDLIKKLCKLSNAELKMRGDHSAQFIQSNHTTENFTNKYRSFLNEVLN